MLFDSLYDAFIVLLGILLLCAAHALHIAQALRIARALHMQQQQQQQEEIQKHIFLKNLRPVDINKIFL